jgi:hypothetical protein
MWYAKNSALHSRLGNVDLDEDVLNEVELFVKHP